MSSLRQLKVTFDSFDEMVGSIGPGLSRTHIYARTDEVIDDGTRVRLEIGTAGKGALIRGVAKVSGLAEDGAGLHLHLIHLDPSSTRLVDSIVRGEVTAVDAQEPSGPSPFDIPSTEPAPPEPEMSPPAVPSPDALTEDTPTVAAESPAARHLAWALALIVLAGAALWIFNRATGDGDEHQVLTGRDRQTEASESLPSSPPTVAPPQGTASDVSMPAEVPTEAPPDGAPDPAPSDAPASPQSAAAQIEDVVHAWADAWSRQDSAAYIDRYAAAFSPEGLDRGTWERQRRQRINAPERLEVSVNDLEIEIIALGRSVASFQQLYVTEEKKLVTRKVLELERSGSDWKIVAERVER